MALFLSAHRMSAHPFLGPIRILLDAKSITYSITDYEFFSNDTTFTAGSSSPGSSGYVFNQVPPSRTITITPASSWSVPRIDLGNYRTGWVDDLASKLEESINYLFSHINSVKDVVSNGFSILATPMNSMVGHIRENTDWLLGKIEASVAAQLAPISTTIDGIVTKVNNVPSLVTEIGTGVISGISDKVNDVFSASTEWITDLLASIGSRIATIGRSGYSGFVAIVDDVIDILMDFIENILDRISSFGGDIPVFISFIGTRIIGILNNVKAVFEVRGVFDA